MKHQLDFEKPIVELQSKLAELKKHPETHSLGISFEEEVSLIEKKLEETKRQIFSTNQRHKTDTGSPEVQIALLSTRITMLTEHFKTHKKDHGSRKGLLTLVAKRRRLLTYLRDTGPERYKAVLLKLGIRR